MYFICGAAKLRNINYHQENLLHHKGIGMTRQNITQNDEIEMMFQLMEYYYLTNDQHKLICDYESQFENRGSLSDRQFEVLKSIFEKASQKVEWSR